MTKSECFYFIMLGLLDTNKYLPKGSSRLISGMEFARAITGRIIYGCF